MSWAWPKVSFDEAPLQIIDGDRGKNYPKQDEFGESGHCLFLNTGNVTKSGFNFEDCQFITEQKDNLLRKGKLTRDDVIMTTRGTIGNVGYFNRHVPFENIRINSGMVIFRTDDEKLRPSFLYQYLRSEQFNKQVNSLRSGAAQPQLPIRDIKVIELPLPPLDVQEAISEVIGKYDDLIENNKRRIKLLEESARQLYKEWFVRFRFPGHEHVKVINGVPEGWSKKSLVDLLEIKHGFAFKGEFFSDDPTPLILMTPGNFKIGGGIKLDKKKYYSEGAPIPEDYILEENELLVTMTDLSKTSDTLGFPALVPKPNSQIFLHNQRLGKVSYKQNTYFPKYYFYHVFLDNRYRAFVVGSASGTAVKHTSPKKILSYEHLMPNNASSPLIVQFNEFAKGVYNQINTLLSWNENLVKARDLLLPKLMNGEIAV